MELDTLQFLIAIARGVCDQHEAKAEIRAEGSSEIEDEPTRIGAVQYHRGQQEAWAEAKRMLTRLLEVAANPVP